MAKLNSFAKRLSHTHAHAHSHSTQLDAPKAKSTLKKKKIEGKTGPTGDESYIANFRGDSALCKTQNKAVNKRTTTTIITTTPTTTHTKHNNN